MYCSAGILSFWILYRKCAIQKHISPLHQVLTMKFQKFQSQIENLRLEEILAYETGVHLGDGSLQKMGRIHRVIYCGDIENDYKFYALQESKFKKII